MKIKKLINIFSDSKINIVLGIVSAILLLGAIAVAVVVFGIVLPQANNAEYALSTGIKATGGVIGVMKGSYEGVTVGLQEGAEEGKEAGLSAEDTEVAIVNGIKELGQLEVLCASVSMYNEMIINDKKGVKYSCVDLYFGDAIFSVDFSLVVVENREDVLVVTLPKPELELVFDEVKTEKLAQYQRGRYTGSAEDGYIAAQNSRKKAFEEAGSKIIGYDTLNEKAMESAKNNIELLVSKMRVDGKRILVQYAEEVE